MNLKIDQEFKSLIPPLSDEEYKQLEQNIITDGCRDPLVIWKGTIVDGHNRYEICTKKGVSFNTTKTASDTRDDAVMWIIKNQFGRRNLSAYTRSELALKLAPLVEARAKANQLATLKQNAVLQKSAERSAPIDTRREIAKAAGVSHDTVMKVKKIAEKAPEEVKAKLRTGEISINKAHADITREEKRASIVEKLEDIKTIEAKAASGKYDVIVIDPPWPMAKIERDERPNQSEFDYPTMTEAEILNFDGIKKHAAEDCHIFLWTTNKFLPLAFRCLESWGARYVACMVWHKPGGFQVVGLPQFNCEFALYGRIGSPAFIDTKQFFTCFNAARGAHSEKPQDFYDVVKRVTAGRRLDMFNRRSIDGFDGWGNQAK